MRQFRYLLALLFAVALVAAACGDSDDTDDASSATTVTEESTGDEESTTPEVPAEAESATAGGLEVARVDLSTGTAQVINTGDAPVDLSGHWVCNRPNYSELPPVELGPGEGIEVEVAGVSETGGEVAIYTSNNFESSDDIVSYVQWGSGGGRASVAEEAGVWSGPPVDAAQEAIALVGEPGSAEAWE